MYLKLDCAKYCREEQNHIPPEVVLSRTKINVFNAFFFIFEINPHVSSLL